MDFIRQGLDSSAGYRIKCPMCSEEFCNLTSKSGSDFKRNQGNANPSSVLGAAWLRCVLFTPTFAREACLNHGKEVIVMRGTEVRKLVFLGKEKVIFYQCEGLLDPVESENKRKWLKRQYGGHLPYTVEQMTQMGIAQSEAKAIAYAFTQSTTNLANPPTLDGPLELEPPFDTIWILINHGKNQYIMSPFLSESVNQWIYRPVRQEKGVTRTDSREANSTSLLGAETKAALMVGAGGKGPKEMTAEEFNDLAKENGGLLAAVKEFDASKDEDIKQHRTLAEQWLQHLLAKNKPDGVAGPKYEFLKRVKDAYDVKLNFTVPEEGAGGEGDDWEDEDEDEDEEDD